MGDPGALLWGFLLLDMFREYDFHRIRLNYNIHYVK